MAKLKIKYIDFGLAYTDGNTIEINKVIKKYPIIYKKIIEHELGHKEDTEVDFMHDLKNVVKQLFDIEWYKFMLKEPKAYFQTMCPIWYCRKTKDWYINVFLLMLYGIAIFIGILLNQR